MCILCGHDCIASARGAVSRIFLVVVL